MAVHGPILPYPKPGCGQLGGARSEKARLCAGVCHLLQLQPTFLTIQCAILTALYLRPRTMESSRDRGVAQIGSGKADPKVPTTTRKVDPGLPIYPTLPYQTRTRATLPATANAVCVRIDISFHPHKHKNNFIEPWWCCYGVNDAASAVYQKRGHGDPRIVLIYKSHVQYCSFGSDL